MSNKFSFEKDGWIVRSASKNLTQTEPHTRVEIVTGGCVVATVEPRCVDEEPDLHFVGQRPFRLDRDTFWTMAALAVDLAKVFRSV